MSQQRVAIQGCTPYDYSRRAALVCDLAAQLRDVDPSLVWDYLTCLPSGELQRLTMVALAGIDVDRPISDVFGWVEQLPVAKYPAEALAL